MTVKVVFTVTLDRVGLLLPLWTSTGGCVCRCKLGMERRRFAGLTDRCYLKHRRYFQGDWTFSFDEKGVLFLTFSLPQNTEA